MEERQRMRKVSMTIPVRHHQYFSNVALERGVSKSQLFLDMIQSNYYTSRNEVTENAVGLMDAIHDLEGKCDDYLYERLRKAGEQLCQSLLIN